MLLYIHKRSVSETICKQIVLKVIKLLFKSHQIYWRQHSLRNNSNRIIVSTVILTKKKISKIL